MKHKELLLIANELRQDIIRLLVEAKSGHTAGPLGMTDVFTVLYFNHAMVDQSKPLWGDRDYILLSNGHICPIWYATLARKGYFPKEELLHFRKINSLLQGHPHMGPIPGVENSGGPLAQGLSQAAGVAKALQIDKKPNKVYCLCSDGEHDEGQAWEAALFAAFHKLGNLTLIMDRNNIQIDGPTDKVMSLEPLADKYRAFGWHVMEIDGHDMNEIKSALRRADTEDKRPSMIIAKTIPGKGVKEFENNYEWHGKPPSPEQGEHALKELTHEHERLQKRWF